MSLHLVPRERSSARSRGRRGFLRSWRRARTPGSCGRWTNLSFTTFHHIWGGGVVGGWGEALWCGYLRQATLAADQLVHPIRCFVCAAGARWRRRRRPVMVLFVFSPCRSAAPKEMFCIFWTPVTRGTPTGCGLSTRRLHRSTRTWRPYR